ncbi:MAG TPA: GNAT family N-acetyltransferase [Acidimicrobiales bacterium]|nr:GNAT family N-acetyltransferase [Acidimicrobiales bacterium]
MDHAASPPPGSRTVGWARFTVEVREGRALVDDLADDLDDLHRAAAAPVTARVPWLRAWVHAYQPSAPWAVLVRDVDSGRLEAAGLLCTVHSGDHDLVVPLGRRQLDRGALPARSPQAAAALGMALAARLASGRRPWHLRLGQLPAGDPAAAAVAETLEHARTVPGVPIPKVELAGVDAPEASLSTSMRKQLRKAANRAETDGLVPVIDFVAGGDAVAGVLDEVEHTHRLRERDASRVSDLESSPGLRFWRSVILDHARQHEAEIATLRLDGHLAAYVVSLLDGSSYRVFDGRFSPAWARYSPGRLLETATLRRAAGGARWDEVDWMSGCASEKLLVANAADPTEHLVAASPGLVLDLDVIGRAPTAGDPRRASDLGTG